MRSSRIRNVLSTVLACVLVAPLVAFAGASTASATTVTATGFDFSVNPSLSSIKATGVSFVVLYLDGNGQLTSATDAAYLNAGIDVVANWEVQPKAALGGRAQGVSDAQAAQSAAAADGLPANRPIYFSVDWDVAPGDMAAVSAYFDGIDSVIGTARAGAYSSYDALGSLLGSGRIHWGWQSCSASFSGGRNANPYPGIQLFQNVCDTTVGGVAVDSDQALTTDFGQQRGSVHVQILAGGSSRTVWNTDDDSHGWHNWTQMGGQSFWSIASATIGPVSHYYGVGTDGRVYSRDANYAAGTWSNWMLVPGGATGVQKITATAEGNGVHLEILDNSGKMWNNDANYATGTWGRWTLMGSQVFDELASATVGTTSHYYAIGGDGLVYSRDANYATGTWSNWMLVPGGAAGAIDITATAVGNTVHLEILDNSGTMWNNDADYAAGTWRTWTNLGGSFSALTSTSTGTTSHYLGVDTATGEVYERDADYTTGTWSNWLLVPGGAGGGLAITATS